MHTAEPIPADGMYGLYYCRKGHAYTLENTRYANDGTRRCLTCKAAYNQGPGREKELARRALKAEHRAARNADQDAAWQRVLAELYTATGSSEEFIMSDCKWREAAEPRHVAYYVLRNVAGISWPHIGRIFGRDHSTVIHGARRATKLMAADPKMAALYRRLKAVAVPETHEHGEAA